MNFNPGAVRSHKFETIKQSYTEKDAILYALGVGLGQDPVEPEELRYLFEENLQVLPSFSLTLCSPGMWLNNPQFGVTFNKLVHSAQSTEFHAALPANGTVVATPRVVGVYDRGEGRGAIVQIERTVTDAKTGAAYCTTRQTLILRADGGFGGEAFPDQSSSVSLTRAPDESVSFATSKRAALIYRLSGDRNPLHVDPEFAKQAGFDQPILHGLATYAIACRILSSAMDKTLSSLACRFSGVVMPGDSLVFSLWREASDIRFEAFVDDRKVLDQGLAT